MSRWQEGNVFVNYLRDVRSSVKVFNGEGKPLRDIVFPALGTVGSVYGRWNSGEAFFQFTSFHIPTTIYRYGVADRQARGLGAPQRSYRERSH